MRRLLLPTALLLSLAAHVAGDTVWLSEGASYDGKVLSGAEGDVVINPSLSGQEIDHVVRTLPGVESVTSSALLLAANYEGPSPTKAQLDEDTTGAIVLGSIDG